MVDDADLLARIAAKAARAEPSGIGRGGRSPLARWLTKNREAFGSAIAGKKPDWDGLAEELEQAGIMAGNGTLKPTGTRLRKTWWAVNQPADKPKRSRTAAKRSVAPKPPQAATATAPASDAPKQFRFSKLKSPQE